MAEVFDDVAAGRALQKALEKVSHSMDPEWAGSAMARVRDVALRQEFLTTDDIWMDADLAHPRERRALGAVMRAMAAGGSITPTDRYEPSKRVACHRRPIRIWRSLILQANTMTADQKKLTRHMLNELESPSKPLTAWEVGFVESVTDQFDRKGDLSDTQFAKLETIYTLRTD